MDPRPRDRVTHRRIRESPLHARLRTSTARLKRRPGLGRDLLVFALAFVEGLSFAEIRGVLPDRPAIEEVEASYRRIFCELTGRQPAASRSGSGPSSDPRG
jgi:hypothetical protein